MTSAGDPVVARRVAIVAIVESSARSLIARLVGEAKSLGLGQERLDAYGNAVVGTTLPLALATMRMPDSPERTANTVRLAAEIHEISDRYNIPRIVERGLVAIAVRIVREVVKRGAAAQGFTPDELDLETAAYARDLESALFSD